MASAVPAADDGVAKPIAVGTDFRPLDLGNDQRRDTRAQFPMRKGVRLIGISLSSLSAEAVLDADSQMTLAL